jgi:hypothetical protein
MRVRTMRLLPAERLNRRLGDVCGVLTLAAARSVRRRVGVEPKRSLDSGHA